MPQVQLPLFPAGSTRLNEHLAFPGRITVAASVLAELAEGRRSGVPLPVPEALPWVDVRQPRSPAGVLLAWDLDAGESAALSLALERPVSRGKPLRP